MKKPIGIQIDLKVFGTELQTLISEKGYKNLNDFYARSAQTHISMTSLHDICKGNVLPNFNSLINIANALEISQSEFFSSFSYKYLED